jgi:hypothetical protein
MDILLEKQIETNKFPNRTNLSEISYIFFKIFAKQTSPEDKNGAKWT